ncbi:hypothetical protein VOLCADRAFT_95232, partial [Volvox carteri f. nagariensis]
MQAGFAGPPGHNLASASPPWALMGRMVPADRIALSSEQKQMLITSAAARLSGLDTAAFDAQLQELLLLLPDIRSRLLSLKPAILVELCSDTRGVAYKLVQLREMFPDANVSVIIAKRPTLLTAAEWPGVEVAHRKLGTMFPEGGLGQMVTQQPLLLVEDVDEVVGELERLMPGSGRSGRGLLRSNPDLLLAVVEAVAGSVAGGGREVAGSSRAAAAEAEPEAAILLAASRLAGGYGGVTHRSTPHPPIAFRISSPPLRPLPPPPLPGDSIALLLLWESLSRHIPTSREWLLPGVDVRIMLLRNPGVLTQYRLERKVGEGTYGVVYRATEVATGQTVAVK